MSGAKDFLNRQASARLAQRGYSNRMIDEAKQNAWRWAQPRGQALSRRRGLLAGSAVVWTRLGYAELAPIEVARAGRGEVTVETIHSAVSPGTERAGYLRLPNTATRGFFRPGYSSTARVLSSGVASLAAGDLVAVRGSHSSVLTLPAERVFPLPAAVSAEDGCLFALGVIARQGVRLARVHAGEDVVVIGAGLVGVLAQRIAAAEGARADTMIARSRRRELWARTGGVGRYLTLSEDLGEIESLAAAVVIEATGDPNAVNLAVRTAGKGGRVVLLGSSRGVTADLPVEAMRRKGVELVGAHVETLAQERPADGGDPYRREALRFLDDVGAGKVPVGDLTPTVVDPRDAAGFYRRLADEDVFGARFDWTLLPQAARARPARLLRIPDLSGRGTDSDGKPLPAAPRAGGPLELPDPFAGATGLLRVGLLGCGDIAISNAAAVAAAPNTELAACFDPVRELAADLAERHGGVASASAEELVARDDVDAVFISVPHHLHLPLATLAAEHGKHLMVEKPPANDLAAALELVGVADRNGVRLSFCFPQRYDPAAAAAARLVAAGAIGELEGVVVRVLQERSAAYRVGGFSGRAVSDWRGSRDKAGGGVLIMNMCHYVELVRHLTGLDATEVSAFVSGDREIEDSVSVTVRFSNGAVGTIFGTTEARGALSPELRLFGRDGHVVVQPEPKVYTVVPVEGVRGSRWQSFGELPRWDPRAVYVSRFASSIATGARPEIAAKDGLSTQALIEAAYRSAATGEAVRPADLMAEVLAC